MLHLNNSISIRAITDLNELGRCAPAWNNLFSRSSRASPMQSFGWTYEYLRWKCPSSSSWACIVAESKIEWSAVLVVIEDDDSGANSRRLNVLFDGHLNICDVLTDDRTQEDVTDAVFRYCFECFPKTAYLMLARVPSYSKLMQFARDNATSKTLVFSGRANGGSYLNPVSSPDTYERSLSRNFRANLSKARKKLSKTGEWKFEVITDPQKTVESLRRFAALEGSGWKGRAGTSLDHNPDLFAFYMNATKLLAEEGLIEWHFLRSGDTDIAAHLAFRLDSRLVLWKIGYNDKQKALSPGTILLQELIRWEFGKSDPIEIDTTTNQEWHHKWHMSIRPYYQVRIYNERTLAGLVAYYRDRIIAAAREQNWLRRFYTSVRHWFE